MRCDYCGWLNSDDAKRCVKCNQELVEVTEPQPSDVSTESEQPSSNEPEPQTKPGSNFKATVKFVGDVGPVNLEPEVQKVMPTSCTSCGYPFASEVSVCPACGAAVEAELVPVEPEEQPTTVKIDSKATVRDLRSIEAILNSENQPEEAVVSPEPQPAKSSVNFKQTVRDFGCVSEGNGAGAAASVVAKTVIDEVDRSLSAQSDCPSLVAAEDFGNGASGVSINSHMKVINRMDIDPSNSSIDEDAHIQIEFSQGEWYVSDLSKLKNTYVQVNRKMKLEKGDVIVVGNRRYIFQ